VRPRDPKGLYALAYAGEIEGFTGRVGPLRGAGQPGTAPGDRGRSPAESAAVVLAKLVELRLAPVEVVA